MGGLRTNRVAAWCKGRQACNMPGHACARAHTTHQHARSPARTHECTRAHKQMLRTRNVEEMADASAANAMNLAPVGLEQATAIRVCPLTPQIFTMQPLGRRFTTI